ncbi:MAG: P1 family peptidase [Anaerolineae bacterium]
MARQMHHAITDVPGIRVGHATDLNALTGCTVVLCEDGAVGGVDQRGGAPGTRETDLLRPMHLVQHVNAVLLTGGSAFGLDAAAGVVRYLEERQKGFPVGVHGAPVVPIVAAAVLFDLDIGDAQVRPDAALGYAACEAASDGPVAQGSVGAGTGATVGKIFGGQYAMKGGIGSASADLGNGLVIGALIAVNCLGDVIDPHSGSIIAGARRPPAGTELADTLAALKSMAGAAPPRFEAGNTVIGVVAASARLTKEEANKVAQMAHDGLARAIRPAHTMFDGDTLFALATGQQAADVNLIGAVAAEVVAEAVVNAVRMAEPLGGRPSAAELAGRGLQPPQSDS